MFSSLAAVFGVFHNLSELLKCCSGRLHFIKTVLGHRQEGKVSCLAVPIELVRPSESSLGFRVLAGAVLGHAKSVEDVAVVRIEPAGGLGLSQGEVDLLGVEFGLFHWP